jgi:hypothetical protein
MKVQKSIEKKSLIRKKRADSAKTAAPVKSPAATKKIPSAFKPFSEASKVERAAETTEAPGKNYVTVNYPQEGEIITSGHYTFRILTSAMENVDVSIDGKEWQPCRECVGFWWYDWSGYGAGAHTIVARIAAGKRFMKSKARSFTVLI